MRSLIILFFSFSLFSYGFSESIFLKNHLAKAESGDYLVMSQGKCYTLFHIFDRQNAQLTVEEVTIPSHSAKEALKNWKEWLVLGAKRNTSWTLFKIDLQTGKLHHFYSFTKQNWYDVPEENNFLQTLLQLEFLPLPYEMQRRMGSASRGALAKKTIWQPKMIRNGQAVNPVECESYLSKWPDDGSQLSGKSIYIYLCPSFSDYPSYFPFWIQVMGGIGRAQVRIIDGGKGAHSPQNGFPNKM